MFKVKKLHPDAKLPTRGSKGAGGYDLYATNHGYSATTTEGVSAFATIETGIAIEIPKGFVGILRERSGLGKRGVRLHGGVIDSDYRGEIIVVLSSQELVTYSKGDRIAQLLIVPCLQDEVVEVDELSETTRGGKGFGSTGR